MNKDNTPEDIETTEHHFALLETLGEGAMGEVVLARDQDLFRKVAIKKIKQQVSRNQFLLESFITEAQITAQLEHPSIIPVYGLEVNEQGHMAYSMKRIEGQTLKALIKSAQEQFDQNGQVDPQYSLTAFLEHFLKVTDAIEYAHQKGIIHRDLKPDNIMIGPYNEVYVLDWGIARPMTGENDSPEEETIQIKKTANEFNKTESKDVYGTPCYMSPEQAAGFNEHLNGQSDLYSLGLILFELVSLKQGYTAEKHFNKTINKSVDGKMNALEPYHPNLVIPRELKAIIAKSTSRKRKERYNSVKDMSDEVRRYLRGEAVLAQPDTAIQKTQRWLSQNKEKTLALILAIFFISSLIIGWSFYKRYTDHLKAQKREQTLANFLNIVGDKSQEINAHFLELAGLTQEFASAMEQLLENGASKETDYYTFQKAQKGIIPPDLKSSKVYPVPVSLNYPLFKVAPGINPESVEPQLRQIATYAHFIKRLFIPTHGKSALEPFPEDIDQLVHNKDILAIDAFAGFEEGFSFIYPGHVHNPDYDARKRPWYKVAKNTHGYQWGQPYLDSMGLGWVIPCTKALYDSKNAFRGAVGIDMKVEHLRQVMKLPQTSHVKEVYLLNQQGQILIHGSKKRQFHKSGTLINELEQLKTFPEAEIVREIKAQIPSGFYQTKGRYKKTYTYHHLSSTRWYYLVEADSRELFSNE